MERPRQDLLLGLVFFAGLGVLIWATMTLSGPLFGSTLTGRGTVTRGVLYFEDLITKQILNLDDPRYVDLIDTSLIRRQGLREEFDSRFVDRLRIDSLALEMELFARAGLKPLEVIRLATLGGAEGLGVDHVVGSLEPGKLADILLLDADPLEDIRNSQAIWRVIKGGWLFDPQALRPARN